MTIQIADLRYRSYRLCRLALACIGLCLLAVAPPVSAGLIIRPPIIPIFIRGDVNGDDDINISDLALLASSFTRGGPALPCLDAADVNDDGRVSLIGGGLLPLPGDVDELQEFLLSLSPVVMGGTLPAPFPTAGFDLTADPIGCADSSGPSPVPNARGYGFDWEISPGLVRGSRRQFAFGLATTAASIDGLSYACLVDTDAVRVSSVTPVLEDGLGAGGTAAPVFDWVQKATRNPRFDLLLLTLVYVDVNGVRIDAPPRQGPVNSRRVFRVVFDVLGTAPLGVTEIFQPFFGGYAGEYGEITGLTPLFSGVGRGSQSPPPGGVKSADPLIVGNEPIFLRGDSNADGLVNIADPVYTLRGLFLEVGLGLGDPADANDNGAVTLTDAVFTLDFLFKANVTTLPEPYPECGEDPPSSNIEFLFNLTRHENCFSL